MKKITILILTMVTLIYGQETAITTTGKRVTLNKDFTWSYIESKTEEGFDFRKTNWGMSMAEVSATESLEQIESGSDNILMYNGQVSELDCVIVYFFTNKLLTSSRYYFSEKHSNDNDFLSDYNRMTELLTKKYGEPTEDDDFWKNDLYKDDYSSWGFAVSLGHYIKYASWVTDKTEIDIGLSGENYNVKHMIDYTSVEFKDLEETSNASSAIEDL